MVISQRTVSADKNVSYTLRNAMETCLIVDGGNPARHAEVTGDISLKNSTGISRHYWNELRQWFPFSCSRRLLESSSRSPSSCDLKQYGLICWQCSDHESRHPPVAKSIRRDEASNQEPKERANCEVHVGLRSGQSMEQRPGPFRRRASSLDLVFPHGCIACAKA